MFLLPSSAVRPFDGLSVGLEERLGLTALLGKRNTTRVPARHKGSNMLQHSFLQRVLPLLPTPDAFGSAPVYFSLGLNELNNTREQNPHSSIHSLVTQANAMSNSGMDAYMALASFASALSGRKQNNAFECRCIWADIDAGKRDGQGNLKSKYATAKEALADLHRFITITGLEPTVLVSSGKGLHAYWTFDKNISAPVWQQLAALFHQLCIQEGLDVDPTRACDTASVLRLPGTIHQKSGSMVRLLLDSRTDWDRRVFLGQIAKHLRSAPILIQKPLSPPQVNTHPLASLMGMGFAQEPPKANALNIARNCRQIETMGIGLYPQWFAAMSVLRRCVDGLKWAHALSSLDPRYDPAACEGKFYNAAEDAPARCATFEMANPTLCQQCIHRGRIKSPVQLSSVEVSQPPAPKIVQSPVAPANSDLGIMLGHPTQLQMAQQKRPHLAISDTDWKVDHRGVVMITAEKDANGGLLKQEHVICPVQILFKHTAHRKIEDRHKTLHYFEAVYPNGMTRELVMVAEDDKSEHSIMKWLSAADINPNGRGAYGGRVFVSFFNAYLNSVMNAKTIMPIVKEFGWTRYNDPVRKHDIDGFVVGGGIITESGMHAVGHDPGTTGIFADQEFHHAGTLEEWKHVPRMYTTLGQKMGEFAICCSVASSLMKWGIAEAKNVYLNLFSNEGGKGKSTLARAMFSVWGNPEHAFGSPNASMSNRGKKLSVFNNLPFIVDEITRMKDDDMQSMVYILAGGKDKDRSKSNADLTKTGMWSTCTMSTANRSVKEALSRVTGDTDATLLRVIEYECDFPSYDGMPPVQEYIRACIAAGRANYGVAGPTFIHNLLQHSDRLLTLTQVVDNWRIKRGIKDNERYLGSGIGLALIAGRWCVEWGILDFDMDALEQWCLDILIPFNRQNTADLAPDFVDNMSVYLNQRQPNTVVVLRAKRGPGEPDPRSPFVPDKYVTFRPVGEIIARYEQENGEIKFSSTDFKAWCNRFNISERVLLQNLNRKGIYVEKVRANLGEDISWLPTSRARCYAIRKDGLQKLGFTPQIPVQPIQNPHVPIDPLSSLLMK